MRLEGAVAVLTGAATGVGAACARRLAAKGCNLALQYRASATAAEAVAAACRHAGVGVITVRGDVAEDTDCRALAAAAMREWGRIDVLVNAAGTTRFVPHADLDGLSAGDFARIFAVNVTGAYQMARAVAAPMRAGGNAAIVNVSSVSGIIGDGSCIAYAASKGALNTLTKSLARALAPEIRVNAVCPDYITGRWLLEGVGQERYDQVLGEARAKAPLDDVATPDDVAEAILWLIEGGRMVTGTQMVIDGGIGLGK